MSLATLAASFKRQSSTVDLWGHVTWFQRLVVILGVLLNHSVPLFPHLSNGDDNSTYFIRSLERLCLNHLINMFKSLSTMPGIE